MNEKSPLIKLGEAIDNGEFPGIVSKYKCEKCGREAEWETYIGMPMQRIPCGGNCSGYVVLQQDNKRDEDMIEDEHKRDEYEEIKKDLMEMVNHKHGQYSISNIMNHMREKGYENIGKIIEDTLIESIFSIGKIGNDGTVWLKLSSDGEELWDKYNEGKEGYFEKEKEEINKIHWKCSLCSYQYEGDFKPLDKCPGCYQSCSFIDATCYIPECKLQDERDRRI